MPHEDRSTDTLLPKLSGRQRSVLALIGQGRTTKEIAAVLQISVETISGHRKKLCTKLGLHSTASLAAFAGRVLSEDPLSRGLVATHQVLP
jgi:DNA-binding CsgD family transcriptional regulator